MAEFSYEASQVDRLKPSDAYKLKILGEDSETKWLDITPDQLAQIRATLTGQVSQTTTRFIVNDKIMIMDGWFMTPAFVNVVAADGRPTAASAWHDAGVRFDSTKLGRLTWWKPTDEEWNRVVG